MAHPKRRIEALTLILILQISVTQTAKNQARPVHEVINEQARIDDKRVQTNPGILPYGNPLAGNSQHNAKLHAQNQQAMFNAERVRQHRAQTQRWSQGQTDSYMRAYHESQENHQLALEQQQSNFKDPVSSRPSYVKPYIADKLTEQLSQREKKIAVTVRPLRQRQRLDVKRSRGLDPVKGVVDESPLVEKIRSHRSHGSVDHKNQIQPKSYRTVFLSPGPTYDQGVTIKPNGNAGHVESDAKEESSFLFTHAVPSKTQYVYPKQYSQMQSYESAHDIAALNNLLQDKPQDQLTKFNALIQTDEDSAKLETPVDLYFYLKDPNLAPYYAQAMYGQVSENHVGPITPDHIPITEEIDDVEDPNKVTRRPQSTTPIPEQISTSIVHFYPAKPTVAVVTTPAFVVNVEEPTYSALKYEKPLRFTSHDADGDHSERYLHHNAQHTGVQHLSSDGSEVSAYGDDSFHYAANYEFGYHVKDLNSGNDFGHREAKTDGKTDGQYHVLLPDGRMQNVIYRAGPDGFHADISYER